ncbi:MAG: retroviral-like aspartic protease, partial [Hymenobacter sp.]
NGQLLVLSFNASELNRVPTKEPKNSHTALLKINVRLGDKDAHALIDSGASHRFVKRQWLQDNGIRGGIKGARQVVKQANGTFESLLHSRCTTFHLHSILVSF